MKCFSVNYFSIFIAPSPKGLRTYWKINNNINNYITLRARHYSRSCKCVHICIYACLYVSSCVCIACILRLDYENYKTRWNKIKIYINEQSHSWTRRLNIFFRWQCSPNWESMQSLNRISADFADKPILKFIWTFNRPKIAKTILIITLKDSQLPISKVTTKQQ